MRILYDGFIYKLQKAGGIGRYFNNIIQRLPNDLIPILTTSNSQSNIELPNNDRIKLYNFKHFRPYRLSFKSEKYFFQLAESLANYDIIHPTYYTLLSERKFTSIKKPQVITIHDMIMEIFKGKIDDAEKHMKWKEDAIASADAIICVSENTKKDLLRFHPEVESKIRVIYEGSELSYDDSFGDEKIPEKPYFLYVGSRAVYKNFFLLLHSFPKVLSVQKDLILAIVGPPLTADESKVISQLGLTGKISYYGFVSSQHLAKLYRCGIALVYPSLYEGFGLPPLEAMTCRTAVIAANVSSVPEIVGDGGILIDPDSENELADSMIHLIQNPSERSAIIERGVIRSKYFDWDKNVNEIVKLYRTF